MRRLQQSLAMTRVLLIAVLLSACARPAETPAVGTAAPPKPRPAAQKPAAPPAPIRTDRTSYVLTIGPDGPEATIVSTLRAPADQTLYIVNCNNAVGATLQRKVGETWEYAFTSGSAACLSAPIVIPPGGEHTSSVYIQERPDAMPGPRNGGRIEPGTYRVIWSGVLTSFDMNKQGFGPELPLEQRVSAPITIERPR